MTTAEGTADEATSVVAETSPALQESSQLASSPTQLPADQTVSRPAPAASYARRPQAGRTYGKKVVIDAPAAETPGNTDAPLPPSHATGRALASASSVVLPETDFEPRSETTEQHRWSASSRADSSPRGTVHSTDPTSEEEQTRSDEGKATRPYPQPTRAAAQPLRTIDQLLASDDSDDGEEGDKDAAAEDEMLAFLKAGRNLHEVIEGEDTLFPSPKPVEKAPVAAPTSSSLPTLTPSTNDLASSSQTQRRKGHSPARRARNAVGESSDDEQFPAPESGSPAVGTSKMRWRPRIADSEDEAEPAPSAAAAETPALSHKDRLKLLADKRRGETKKAEPVPAQEEPDEIDAIVNGGDAKKSRKQGRMKKPTKKETEEMHKTSAELARKKDIRLAPSRKVNLSVMEMLKSRDPQFDSPRPTIHRSRSGSHRPENIIQIPDTPSDPIASSQSVEDPASGHVDGPATPARTYTLKALAQKHTGAPSSDRISDTPVPRKATTVSRPDGWLTKRELEAKKAREASIVPPAADDDDEADESLEALDMGAILQKTKEDKERERKQKALEEAKARALAAARSTKSRNANISDSDSDLEIEGLAKPQGKAALLRGRSRSPSAQHETLAGYADHKASSTSANSARRIQERYGRVGSVHPTSEDAEPSESQYEAAGRTFGAHLDPRMNYGLASASKRRSSSKVPKSVAPTITLEDNNLHLRRLAQKQNAKERQKKELKARREANARAAAPALESVNVNAMVKEKQSREEEDEQMEEQADSDYVDEDAYDSADAGSNSEASADEVGSGSDTPDGRQSLSPIKPKKVHMEVEEDDLDSEGELVLPKSSQNEDRLGRAPDADAADDDAEEEDEATSMPPPAKSRRGRKVKIADDEDEDDEPVPAKAVSVAEANSGSSGSPAGESAANAADVVPKKFALGGLMADFGAGDDGDGGFSQFFNSQFSQGGENEDGIEGLRRAGGDDIFAAPASTMLAVQPLIGTAERAADADRLEARGGFNDFEVGTPREVAAPRRYINEKGLLTQTRPAANFDSPTDTPLRTYRQSMSTYDSQSQAFEETQLATEQTPTQAFRHQPNLLRRMAAIVPSGSTAELAATEVDAARSGALSLEETQVDRVIEGHQEGSQSLQEETQDVRPSAAQVPAPRPRNAFDLLHDGAHPEADRPAAAPAKRRVPNQFIETEANLSDEEDDRGRLGSMSADENEDDDDRELEELVDNTKEKDDVEAEQDEKARELLREQEAKAEQEALVHAQRVAAGKERKRGRNDLDDDDFDDDYVARTREKRERVAQETVADLKQHEETRDFAESLDRICAPEAVNEAWLNETQDSSDDEYGDEPMAEPEDVLGPIRAVNPHDVRRTAAELQRKRAAAASPVEDELDVDSLDTVHVPGLLSSSPGPRIEIRDSAALAATKTTRWKGPADRFPAFESTSLMFAAAQSDIQYGSNGGEDSQTRSIAAGNSKGAITSFKRSAAPATKRDGVSAAPGKAKSAALGPRDSTLGGLRARSRAFE